MKNLIKKLGSAELEYDIKDARSRSENINFLTNNYAMSENASRLILIKTVKKKENKTISALIVKDSLLKAMKLKKVTLMQLNVSV